MTRIVQITDPHLLAPPALLAGRLDSAGRLRKAVADIAAALPRIGPVDALLVTGDVSDDGSAESYALFRETVAALDLPVHVIPGNHDRREPMRRAFAPDGYLPDAGRLNWVADLGELRLIGLDTLVEGQGGGLFDAETAGFLQAALEGRGDAPNLVALHHPPFPSGIAYMDALGLEGIPALERALRGAGAATRIVCGHVHASMLGAVAGVPALAAAATCSTFAIDFRADAPIGFLDAPGGFVVHDSANGMRSVFVPPDPGAGPFPF